jgi:multicomponent Na+:H+ antiporter subunit E
VTETAVLVSDRGRLADTVSYALREGRDVAQERTTVVRFLVPVGAGPDALPLPAARALLERVRAVVASEPLGRLAVETDAVRISGADASARTGALVDRLPEGVRRVVLMPELVEFDPAGVRERLASRGRLGTVSVERAPVGRRIARPPVAFPRTPRRVAAVFGASLGFYLLLGDPTSAFDLATGALSAVVVAVVLSRVVLERDPTAASLGRVLRAGLFLPYLLVAVVRANLAMAAVVLHPRLPVDPRTVRVPAPEGRMGAALLANSITLTPGTLTVDVEDGDLLVHTLTEGSRADLEAGGLSRAVSFVLEGTAGADAPAGAGRSDGGGPR